MNVHRIDRRKVELPDRAIRALQLLAHLDKITPQEMLERLIVDFLELRWDDVNAAEQMMTPPPRQRQPAKVIELDHRRRRHALREAGKIVDVMQRSQALRAQSTDLRQRSRDVRTRAQQKVLAAVQMRGRHHRDQRVVG